MSNEVTSGINSEVIALFKEFDDEYLADVLRIWDCDAGEWCDIFTIVYRFENNDLLVWKDSDKLCARIGAVETDSMINLIPQTSEGIRPAEVCLSWRFDRGYDELIGRIGVASEILARIMQIYPKSE